MYPLLPTTNVQKGLYQKVLTKYSCKNLGILLSHCSDNMACLVIIKNRKTKRKLSINLYQKIAKLNIYLFFFKSEEQYLNDDFFFFCNGAEIISGIFIKVNINDGNGECEN